MNLKNYTLIAYKLMQRPWGPECRYTVSPDTGGVDINDVISIPDMKILESDLAKLIQERLVRIDVSFIPGPVPEVLSEMTVEKYLKDNGYIKPKQTLEMVKTQMMKIIEVI